MEISTVCSNMQGRIQPAPLGGAGRISGGASHLTEHLNLTNIVI